MRVAMLRFDWLLVAMLLVRQVAPPDAAGSTGCSSRCCWFGRLLVPKVPCFALWSCFPMVLCAFPGGSCFPMVLCAFPAGSCLSMVSPAPAEKLHATAPAERQPLPHRLALRFIPPAALRLRVLSFTRAWSPTVCAEEFPTPLEASFAILQLLPGQAAASSGPGAPDC